MTDAPSTPTGRIFISYRRQDAAYPAGWLYDRLAERFGPERIFKDVDSIELGDDFVETITNAVGSCDILLALVGQEWLDIAGSNGTRRLDDPDDFVRIEIEAALARKVLLIPVLVDGVTMPTADQLPPSIAPLVRRQALELSPNRFKADTDRLLDVISRTLSDLTDLTYLRGGQGRAAVPSPQESAETARRSPVPRWMMLAAGAAAVAVVAAGVAVAMSMGEDDPKKPPKLGGPDAPIVLAHRGGDEKFAWQTLPAYEYAAGIGAQIETDVRWTKDGVPVLVHDPGTTPGMECEGGNLIVKDTNWPELRDQCRSPAAASKDGKQYPIPTFDEAVSAVAKVPDAEIFAEVKTVQDAKQVRQFLAILQNVKMIDRAVVTSLKAGELTKIRAEAERIGEDVRTMRFVSKQRVPAADLSSDLWGVAVQADIATLPYVSELQAKGFEVMIFVVNTPEQWEEAKRLGADLVLTGKPTAFGTWAESN